MSSTYQEVARAHGLTGVTARRYISYMRTRWADTEGQKSRDGYAGEWAERFKHGREYSASDSTGQRVLKEMDGLRDY